jgi:hypothetical protein
MATKQGEILLSEAKRLVETLETAPVFELQKAAVTDFITATYDPAHVLGDGDLMKIVVRSCRHRNKDDATIKRLLDYELGLPE